MTPYEQLMMSFRLLGAHFKCFPSEIISDSARLTVEAWLDDCGGEDAVDDEGLVEQARLWVDHWPAGVYCGVDLKPERTPLPAFLAASGSAA